MNITVEQYPYRIVFTDDTREGADDCMHFYLAKISEDGDEWETIDAGAYCTQVSARLPKKELEYAARLLLRRFISGLGSGLDLKRSAERLTWIGTDHVQRSLRNDLIDELMHKYNWADEDIAEHLLDFVANRGLLRSLRNYLDDVGQEQQQQSVWGDTPLPRAVLPVPCGGEQYYEVHLRRRVQQTATLYVLAPTRAPCVEIGDIVWKNEAGDAGWQDNLEAGAEADEHIVVPASSEVVRSVADVYGRICEDGHFERVFTE